MVESQHTGLDPTLHGNVRDQLSHHLTVRLDDSAGTVLQLCVSSEKGGNLRKTQNFHTFQKLSPFQSSEGL